MSNAQTLDQPPGSTVDETTRTQVLQQFLADARQIVAQGPVTRASLDALSERLMALAALRHLFSATDFPPPVAGSGDTSVRYRLAAGAKAEGVESAAGNDASATTGIALYLNSLLPGKTTIPHNHDTWAVIAAVDGVELNRVYRRIDDGTDPEFARIVQEKEVEVCPGTPIAFMPEDIHSIHVEGDKPTLHFHLYGRPLDTLTGRIGIEPDSGRIVRYNQKHGNASTQAVG